MKDMMKAIVLEGEHKFELKNVPVPQPGEKDVLIKVDTCGICGSGKDNYETLKEVKNAAGKISLSQKDKIRKDTDSFHNLR